MSVKVNLLPRETAARVRQRQVAVAAVGAVAAYTLLLGVVYAAQLAGIGGARAERDAAQAEVARLQSQVAQLAPFRDLANELENRSTLLAAAMSPEISWSRILNDLALTFPGNSSLLTLTANLGGGPAPEGTVAFGPAVASMAFTGYSVERYAPGVESVILELGRAEALFNIYMSSAAVAERGSARVTDFTGSVQLDASAYTNRYVDGLPPEGAR